MRTFVGKQLLPKNLVVWKNDIVQKKTEIWRSKTKMLFWVVSYNVMTRLSCLITPVCILLFTALQPLDYTTLHCTKLHCTAATRLHFTVQCSTTLHCTAHSHCTAATLLHYTALHCHHRTLLHYNALHCFALFFTVLHWTVEKSYFLSVNLACPISPPMTRDETGMSDWEQIVIHGKKIYTGNLVWADCQTGMSSEFLYHIIPVSQNWCLTNLLYKQMTQVSVSYVWDNVWFLYLSSSLSADDTGIKWRHILSLMTLG